MSCGATELLGLCLGSIVAYEHRTVHDGDTSGDEVVIAGDAICAFALLDETHLHGHVVLPWGDASGERGVVVTFAYHVIAVLCRFALVVSCQHTAFFSLQFADAHTSQSLFGSHCATFVQIERGIGETVVHLSFVGALDWVVGNEGLAVVHPYQTVETAVALHLLIWIYMQVSAELGPVRICLGTVSEESPLASRHEVDSTASFNDTAPICIT